MALHRALTISQGIHGIIAGSIANSTSLVAGIVHDAQHPDGRAVTVEDVGKVFQLLTTGVWYGLFSLAPVNWWVIGDGSLNSFEHGDLPGGTLHAVATTTVNGFYSAADKVLNDAHRGNVSNPHATTAGQVGAIATANPMAASGTPTTGMVLTATSSNTATWQVPTGGGGGGVPTSRNFTAGAGLVGGGDFTADRVFNVGAPGDGSIAVNPDNIQVGVLANDAQHGARGGGTQHALATTTTHGFMSAVDKLKLDNSISTPLANTTALALGSAAAGTAASASRADHVHPHGNQPGGSLHATATITTAGFMSAADKIAIDAINTSVFARLAGGNSFTGNQLINGNVAAIGNIGASGAIEGNVVHTGDVPAFAGDIWASRDMRALTNIYSDTGSIFSKTGTVYTGVTPPPANGDIYAANNLRAANSVVTGGSFSYATPYAFTRYANLISDVQSFVGPGLPIGWQYRHDAGGGGMSWTCAVEDSAPLYIGINPPEGSTLRSVRLRVDPNAARATQANRMRARLFVSDSGGVFSYIDVSPSNADGIEYDNGTAAAQWLTFPGLAIPVDKSFGYMGAVLYAGSTTTGDRLYAVEYSFDVTNFLP